MELWNLATNRNECKFYIAVLKNTKTFFFETQFPLPEYYQQCVSLWKEKKAYRLLVFPTAYSAYLPFAIPMSRLSKVRHE